MSGYLEYQLANADVDSLETSMVERFQQDQPDWIAHDGDVLTRVISAMADVLADRLAAAASVPAEIFKYFGVQMTSTQPIAAEAATATATVTLVDDDGYEIPAGTRASQNVDGTEVVFATREDVTIPTGETEATVIFDAEEEGTAANGVSGDLTLVDILSYVDTVTLDAATAGGVDAESDDEYRDRLAARLTLLAPRPILPADFEVMAQDVAGVARARAIDGHDPGTNEVQSVTVTDASGGTFTLTYSGQETGNIAHDAAASAVQTALEALSNIDSGDVACSGGPLGTAAVLVEFTGDLAVTNVAEMTADDTNLTGGGSEAAAVSTSTAGVAPSDDNERTIAISAVDEDGAAIDSDTQTELISYIDSLREVNFEVHWLSPSYVTINVVATVIPDSTADPTVVEEDVEAALTGLIDPATFAGGDEDPPVWRSQDTIGYLEAVGVASRVEGVARITSLTLNGGTSDIDISSAGKAPLPAVGTVTVTIDD